MTLEITQEQRIALKTSGDLIFGNPKSNIGVITLFTLKEKVLASLSQHNFALLGSLYNPSKGISLLLRTCLAHKNIRYLLICGNDLSGSGESLLNLGRQGVEEYRMDGQLAGYQIKGLTDIRLIEKEISLNSINLFRENVQLIDCRKEKDFSKLNEIIKDLKELPPYGDAEFFPEAVVHADKYPSERSLYSIRERFVGEAWLRIIDSIMRFGMVKDSEYAEKQRELINICVTITDEDPENIRWENYFQFSKKHLEDYLPLMLSDKDIDGVSYTYGQRLLAWRGINQLNSLIEKLKKSLNTRRAVAVTWDVEKDHQHDDAPCLDVVQCLVQDNTLYLTGFFRSNDMFEAWPENALALRTMQQAIAKELNLKLGYLTTISGSAHIYERNWVKANELLKTYPLKIDQLNDPRGNIVIYIKDNLITVEHQSPEGIVLEIITGKTYQEIAIQLVKKQKISSVYHALYLGKELIKAEMALKRSLTYHQESDLPEK